MKYMGSKARIAKYILPIMLEEAKSKGITTWIEPFVGGANMIDKVPDDFIRIGNDFNYYIYKLLISVQCGWIPPKHISEELYKEIKSNKDNYPPDLVGYVGSQLTFGSTWFGTYRRDKTGIRNYSEEAMRSVLKQAPALKNVEFKNLDYRDIQINSRSVIYCDPPYDNTFGYEKNKPFNHHEFWDWCRLKSNEGHVVFISEYKAPVDFKSIWSKELKQVINNNSKNTVKPIEKLFKYDFK